MRIFRRVTLNKTHYLYPYPVSRENKYLLLCPSDFYAQILGQLIACSFLPHPDQPSDFFRMHSLHTDQQTKILRCDEERGLPLLPQRNLNLEKAIPVEAILSQKIWRLMNATPSERPSLQAELLHRYQSQRACGECQKMGILEIERQMKSLCQNSEEGQG